MRNQIFQRLGKVEKIDKCRKYFPRYDEKAFREELKYTDEELINYLPIQRRDQYEKFKKVGNYIKIGFWSSDILFVSFCHRLSLFSRFLGEKSWKMFAFKLICIVVPLDFFNRIEQNASEQFYGQLYGKSRKIYKRYKQTGDILDLNLKIKLEENSSQIEKICHLNQFRLVHGYYQDSSQQLKIKDLL